MKKRGQLTIIIFVTIVIVAGILFFYFLITSSKISTTNEEYWQSDAMRIKIDNLNFNLKDCIDTTTKESLIIIGFQGGYYNPPSKRYDYSGLFFPYYYHEKTIYLPTINQIEKELEDYVNDKMIECINQIKIEYIKITNSEPQTKAKINYINLNYLIDIQIKIESRKNSQTIELKD